MNRPHILFYRCRQWVIGDMLFKKLFRLVSKQSGNQNICEEEKPEEALERFEKAFFQISSALKAGKSLPTILAVVAREVLRFLGGSRSTIFLTDEESGNLKVHYTYALIPADKEVNQAEEKEVASEAIRQGSPLLLREPADFSGFPQYREQERKITSLLSIPLFSRGKPAGVLSLVQINEKRSFAEKDMRCLSIFGNQVAIAIENIHLQEEVTKEIGLRKTFERYLDQIVDRLQTPPPSDKRFTGEKEGDAPAKESSALPTHYFTSTPSSLVTFE